MSCRDRRSRSRRHQNLLPGLFREALSSAPLPAAPLRTGAPPRPMLRRTSQQDYDVLASGEPGNRSAHVRSSDLHVSSSANFSESALISFERRKTWWSTALASPVHRTRVGTRLPKDLGEHADRACSAFRKVPASSKTAVNVMRTVDVTLDRGVLMTSRHCCWKELHGYRPVRNYWWKFTNEFVNIASA